MKSVKKGEAAITLIIISILVIILLMFVIVGIIIATSYNTKIQEF